MKAKAASIRFLVLASMGLVFCGCPMVKKNTRTISIPVECRTHKVTTDTTRQPCDTGDVCRNASSGKWFQLRTAKVASYYENESEWSCSIEPSDWIEIIQNTKLKEPQKICFGGRLNSKGGLPYIGKEGYLRCTLSIEETNSP